MATVGWRKSSGVSLQATRVKKAEDQWMADVPVSMLEICKAGSNKSSSVSIFYPELSYTFISSGSVLERFSIDCQK